MTLRVLDLFSGIGGFSLGLERAGMQTAAFCEIEPFPQAVLRKHWPSVPSYSDIRTLTAKQLAEDGIGSIDVICGGYPCQPFSVAGNRMGAEDDRHLWPEYFRLIQELRPAWVIGENVAGHITMGLDAVLSDLESAGYACRPFVIPAVAVDAKHRRDRIWIVANARPSGLCERGFSNNAGENDGLTRGIRPDGVPLRCIEERTDLAHTHSAHSEGNERTERSIPQRANFSEPCRWEPEPAVGRVAHGIPARVDRLKALGNAVVPQIPEIIGRAIVAAHGAA